VISAAFIAWSAAATPDWVKEVDGLTEICSVPVEGDPAAARPPTMTALQALRRSPGAPLEGPLQPPALRTLRPDPIALSATAAAHPARPGWSLVRVELAVAPVATAVEQHITVAVDTSGSMSSASFAGLPLLHDEPPPESGTYQTVGRLELTREVLHQLVERLDGDGTTFALVVFRRGQASTLLDPTPLSNKAAMHAAIDRIHSDAVGSDDLLGTLYRTAAKAFTACADDRVLLFTDDNPQINGDMAEVQRGVRAWAEQGLRLHTFAVGTIADLQPVASLTAAGGGLLQRVDAVAEAEEALVEALRPTGSVASDVRVAVRFPGAWRLDGQAGSGAEHVWSLPDPLPSDLTVVRVYEVEGSAGAVASLQASSVIAGDWRRDDSLSITAAPPLAEAGYGLRHDAAYVLAEAALRDPTQRAAVDAALAGVVREVGPGREAQALLRRTE
jgi:hypothetical protein